VQYDILCVVPTPQLWETTICPFRTLVVDTRDARQLILDSFPGRLPNSSRCKRQLSGRHLVADSGIDQMVSEKNLLSDSLY
jgi:hypothetical protein